MVLLSNVPPFCYRSQDWLFILFACVWLLALQETWVGGWPWSRGFMGGSHLPHHSLSPSAESFCTIPPTYNSFILICWEKCATESQSSKLSSKTQATQLGLSCWSKLKGGTGIVGLHSRNKGLEVGRAPPPILEDNPTKSKVPLIQLLQQASACI